MSFINDESGVTAIEYGVFIGFWGTILVSALAAFTTSFNDSFNYLAATLSSI